MLFEELWSGQDFQLRVGERLKGAVDAGAVHQAEGGAERIRNGR
jgi:hypothetical protein